MRLTLAIVQFLFGFGLFVCATLPRDFITARGVRSETPQIRWLATSIAEARGE
jgi:hypothetical protein